MKIKGGDMATQKLFDSDIGVRVIITSNVVRPFVYSMIYLKC